MDNFLTILYRTYFEALAYEKQLMGYHPEEPHEEIRNDQKITEARKNNDVIRNLVVQYIKNNYDER